MRQGHESDLGIAGLDKLRGLGDVFAEHKAIRYFLVNPEMAQRGDCGPAIGRMLGVGERNLFDGWIEQAVHPAMFNVQRRRRWHPEHKLPNRVAIERRLFGQTGFDQSIWVVEIGGKENIKRSAVLDLMEQIA